MTKKRPSCVWVTILIHFRFKMAAFCLKVARRVGNCLKFLLYKNGLSKQRINTLVRERVRQVNKCCFIIILFVATTVKLEIIGQEVAWPTQTGWLDVALTTTTVRVKSTIHRTTIYTRLKLLLFRRQHEHIWCHLTLLWYYFQFRLNSAVSM